MNFSDYVYINYLAQNYSIKNKGYSYINHLPRTTNVLFYIEDGKVEVKTQIGSFKGTRGELIFIPKGEICSTHFPEESRIFNFFFKANGGAVFSDRAENLGVNTEISSVIQKIISKFSQNTVPDRYQMLSSFYKILHLLMQSRMDSKKFEKLIPALEYMKQNLKEDAPISKYAYLSAMSETGFRKLFVQFSGKSPTEYRNMLRLNAVDELVLDGLPLSEAIFEAGFNSASFYYRLKRRGL